MFAFGPYEIHIQTTWRIRNDQQILVGSADLFYPAIDPLDPPDGWQWDEPNANRADHLLDALLAQHEWFVERIEATNVGDLRIALSGAHVLEIIVNVSVVDECWRFLDSEQQLVVTPVGLDLQ